MTQIINIKHIAKDYGDKEALKDINFDIPYGEHIGIVGNNGCGKSTLLSILAGIENEYSGEIYINKDNTVELVKQDNFFDTSSTTIYEDISKVDRKYLSLLKMSTELIYNIDTLSGGEKTKLALALAFSANPQLLLLDEPTNNLDFEGTVALIKLLKGYDKTVVIVSHDRYFLDNVVDKIIEIEDGKSIEYSGNYSYYRQEKEKVYNERLKRYEDGIKEQKHIQDTVNNLKQWAKKAHQDSTKPDSSGSKIGVKEYKRVKVKKMDKQIKNNINRLEKLIDTSEKRPTQEKEVYFEIKNSELKGKRILQATDISKSYGDISLFRSSNFSIARGEKIALFGPNGCGKTTLVNIIKGDDTTYSGELWISESVTPYVISQSFSELPSDKTVMEYLLEKFDIVTGQDRTTLDNLGLTSKELFQKISTLSYGEKMKLKFAEAIIDKKDFLILDEPTNHLDLHTREMLENTLINYLGTLIIVSHDMYFLKRICDKVIIFESNKISRLEYSFEEYIDKNM